jgi:dTDP-4-dehydrorhamnose reductase
MVILLGSTGYIGQAFLQAIAERGLAVHAPTRQQVDYTDFQALRAYLQATKPGFLINAAGYTGKPNVDACEINRADTLQGNTLFPAMVGQACASLGIPFGHVSSGCIYTGAKIAINGQTRVERDLTAPEVHKVIDKNPQAINGFTEEDEPNFTFRQPPCSFYSGTKAMAEEALRVLPENYIWRLRIPFDHINSPRNFLSKLQYYAKVYNNVNSLSHRGDFVRACLDLWQRKAPFGIYNVTNPGFVSSAQVVTMIQRILQPARAFKFWSDDAEFYAQAAKTPRSNCVMDVSKLLKAGVKMRPVEEALDAALTTWIQTP